MPRLIVPRASLSLPRLVDCPWGELQCLQVPCSIIVTSASSVLLLS